MTFKPVGESNTTVKVNGSTQGAWTQSDDSTYDVQISTNASPGDISVRRFKQTSQDGGGGSSNYVFDTVTAEYPYNQVAWVEVFAHPGGLSSAIYRADLIVNGAIVSSDSENDNDDAVYVNWYGENVSSVTAELDMSDSAGVYFAEVVVVSTSSPSVSYTVNGVNRS
jgi:hypothetical protein